jgi:hypothetical protein
MTIDCGQIKAVFQINGVNISTDIKEDFINNIPEARAFNISNAEICRALAKCGAWKAFGADFWAFRDGHARKFPWSYENLFPSSVQFDPSPRQ